MTSLETYISSRERRDLKYTAQGIANAKIIAVQYGCSGPAFESFSEGIDQQTWSTTDDRHYHNPKLKQILLSEGSKSVYVINQDKTDSLVTVIQRASMENRLGMSKIESHALSVAHFAAFQAFADLPSYLEPGSRSAEESSPDILNNFYSPVISKYPDEFEGAYSDEAMEELHKSFAFTLANTALMIELEKRHFRGTIDVVKDLEIAGLAQHKIEPFPQEFLRELIASQSLAYNQSYYEID